MTISIFIALVIALVAAMAAEKEDSDNLAEALRLLANATDPENAADWEEARKAGWKFITERGQEVR